MEQLKITPDITVTEWQVLANSLQELFQSKNNVSWRIGDLAIVAIEKFGIECLKELVKDAGLGGYEFDTVKRYLQVSMAFPPEERNPMLSHRHHMILQRLDGTKRTEWLEKAHDENLSVKALQLLIKAETDPSILENFRLIFTGIELARLREYSDMYKLHMGLDEIDEGIARKIADSLLEKL